MKIRFPGDKAWLVLIFSIAFLLSLSSPARALTTPQPPSARPGHSAAEREHHQQMTEALTEELDELQTLEKEINREEEMIKKELGAEAQELNVIRTSLPSSGAKQASSPGSVPVSATKPAQKSPMGEPGTNSKSSSISSKKKISVPNPVIASLPPSSSTEKESKGKTIDSSSSGVTNEKSSAHHIPNDNANHNSQHAPGVMASSNISMESVNKEEAAEALFASVEAAAKQKQMEEWEKQHHGKQEPPKEQHEESTKMGGEEVSSTGSTKIAEVHLLDDDSVIVKAHEGAMGAMADVSAVHMEHESDDEEHKKALSKMTLNGLDKPAPVLKCSLDTDEEVKNCIIQYITDAIIVESLEEELNAEMEEVTKAMAAKDRRPRSMEVMDDKEEMEADLEVYGDAFEEGFMRGRDEGLREASKMKEAHGDTMRRRKKTFMRKNQKDTKSNNGVNVEDEMAIGLAAFLLGLEVADMTDLSKKKIPASFYTTELEKGSIGRKRRSLTSQDLVSSKVWDRTQNYVTYLLDQSISENKLSHTHSSASRSRRADNPNKDVAHEKNVQLFHEHLELGKDVYNLPSIEQTKDDVNSLEEAVSFLTGPLYGKIQRKCKEYLPNEEGDKIAFNSARRGLGPIVKKLGIPGYFGITQQDINESEEPTIIELYQASMSTLTATVVSQLSEFLRLPALHKDINRMEGVLQRMKAQLEKACGDSATNFTGNKLLVSNTEELQERCKAIQETMDVLNGSLSTVREALDTDEKYS
eukprot:Nk52_evm2s738 gene=Nk52_evmTU2s738